MTVERCATGILGFDELVEGGFPTGSVILLAGPPGSLKTIFGLEYIYNGASKFNEPSVFVSFQQTPEELKKQAVMFDWDFNPLEERGIVRMVEIDVLKDNHPIDQIKKLVDEINAKRLVIDTISTLMNRLPLTEHGVGSHKLVELMDSIVPVPLPLNAVEREQLIILLKDVKSLGCTSILTYEADKADASHQVIEFLADGVIKLNVLAIGSRTITVEKMRYTKIDPISRSISIDEKGISVGQSIKGRSLF